MRKEDEPQDRVSPYEEAWVDLAVSIPVPCGKEIEGKPLWSGEAEFLKENIYKAN